MDACDSAGPHTCSVYTSLQITEALAPRPGSGGGGPALCSGPDAGLTTALAPRPGSGSGGPASCCGPDAGLPAGERGRLCGQPRALGPAEPRPPCPKIFPLADALATADLADGDVPPTEAVTSVQVVVDVSKARMLLRSPPALLGVISSNTRAHTCIHIGS
jgi:hypothetical protein